MITITVVAILGVLLFLVLRQLFRQPAIAKKTQTPAADFINLKASDARVGDAISIPALGDEFADLDFTVDRRNRYEAGARRWSELSGAYRERRVYMEVQETDDGDVRLQDPRRLTLDDLGISEDDLAQMDERQNTADSFEYDGKVWMYRFSREATFFRDSHSGGSGFYLWEFREEGGKRFISIKKAEGEPFVASLSTQVNPGDITVYRT